MDLLVRAVIFLPIYIFIAYAVGVGIHDYMNRSK